MPLLSTARSLLNQAGRTIRSLDRPSLAIAALILAILAQSSLTRSPVMVAGSLVALGVLVLLSPFLDRKGLSLRREPMTSAILLLTLVGAVLVLKTQSSFRAAIPMYAAAAILFIIAAGGRYETRPRVPEPHTVREILVLLSIVLLGFVLQGWQVAAIPPGFHGDEAESGLQALQLLRGQVRSLISVGWYHLPMMSFAWHAASMRVFGDTIFGLRMSSVIVGTLTLIPFYCLTRLLFNRTTALLATFLLAVSHPFIALNRLGINYTQTTLFEVTAFYFLFRGLRSRRWWDWAVSGLFLGGGLYLYYASRLVPFIVLGYLLCAGAVNRGFFRKHWRGIAVLWLSTILIFAPMAAYFVSHPWHFMSRTSHVFVLGTRGWADTPYPQESVIASLVGQAARVIPIFNYGGDMSGQYGYRGPMLDFITSVFFVLGLGYSFAHARRQRHLFLLIWFWATMIAGGMLTLPAPFVPRLVGALPVVTLFAAVAIQRTLDVLRGAWGYRKATKTTVGALVAVTMIVVAFSNYDIYFNKYLPTVQGWAMREPATAIARYADSLGTDYEVYLLGAPKLYVRHGTIRFIARDLKGTDVLEPSLYIPLRGGGAKSAAYILLPSHLHHLSDLQQYYPRGVVRNFTRESGELWFTAFEVSAEDIAAVAGPSPVP